MSDSQRKATAFASLLAFGNWTNTFLFKHIYSRTDVSSAAGKKVRSALQGLIEKYNLSESSTHYTPFLSSADTASTLTDFLGEGGRGVQFSLMWSRVKLKQTTIMGNIEKTC